MTSSKSSSPRGDAAQAPMPSPCTSVCRMNAASGLCEGCFRTLDEIARWSGMREEEKRAVWRLIEARATTQPMTRPETP